MPKIVFLLGCQPQFLRTSAQILSF